MVAATWHFDRIPTPFITITKMFTENIIVITGDEYDKKLKL